MTVYIPGDPVCLSQRAAALDAASKRIADTAKQLQPIIDKATSIAGKNNASEAIRKDLVDLQALLSKTATHYHHAAGILSSLSSSVEGYEASVRRAYQQFGEPAAGTKEYELFQRLSYIPTDQDATKARATAANELEKLASAVDGPPGPSRMSTFVRGAEITGGALLVAGAIALTIGTDGFGSPALAGSGALEEQLIEEDGSSLAGGAVEVTEADNAAYQEYVARKEAAGGSPVSYKQWAANVSNVAKGDAFRASQMQQMGIQDRVNGWRIEVPQTLTDGSIRRFDLANESRIPPEAFEFKSGSSPTSEVLRQLAADRELVDQGWKITWVLNQPLSGTVMTELETAKILNPDFDFVVKGG